MGSDQCSFLKRLADSAEDFLNVKEEGQARGIRPVFLQSPDTSSTQPPYAANSSVSNCTMFGWACHVLHTIYHFFLGRTGSIELPWAIGYCFLHSVCTITCKGSTVNGQNSTSKFGLRRRQTWTQTTMRTDHLEVANTHRPFSRFTLLLVDKIYKRSCWSIATALHNIAQTSRHSGRIRKVAGKKIVPL